MSQADVFLLLGTGLVAGYVAGLVGVGGGFLFAPVLLFYYESIGLPAAVIPLLTVGTSLLCTLFAAVASGWFQYRRDAVDLQVMAVVGLCSAVAVFVMTRYVTTQPWYTKTVFQLVFAGMLLLVVVRMLLPGSSSGDTPGVKAAPETKARWPLMAGIGSVGGVVSAAVGVGGGVVLVPAYNEVLRVPMHRAVGTSSATIVLISLIGVINYATLSAEATVPATAIGYVDVLRAIVLGVPAAFTARMGVWTAHRIRTQALRWSFAILAALLAVRLLTRALG